jgi:hypothetical protein
MFNLYHKYFHPLGMFFISTILSKNTKAQKNHFLLPLFLIALTLCKGQTPTNSPDNTNSQQLPDSITQIYSGYRLNITEIKILKHNPQKMKVKFNMINTGRVTVGLGKLATNTSIPALILEFDESANQIWIKENKVAFIFAIKQENMKIETGAVITDKVLCFDLEIKKLPPTKLIKETPPTIQIPSADTTKTSKIVTKTESVKSQQKETKIPQPEIKVDTSKVADVRSNTSKKETENKDKKTIPVIDTIKKETIKPTPSTSQPTKTIPKTEVIVNTTPIPKKETIPEVPKLEGTPTPEAKDISICPDLVIDTVKVIKLDEDYIWLEITILNKGTEPVSIFGKKKSMEDNVAIHFYFSGAPRLTRGSVLGDGIFLTEGLKETKGILAPNIPYKHLAKVSLEKKMRFNKVLLLQIDAFNIIDNECDETNNVKAIVPNW